MCPGLICLGNCCYVISHLWTQCVQIPCDQSPEETGLGLYLKGTHIQCTYLTPRYLRTMVPHGKIEEQDLGMGWEGLHGWMLATQNANLAIMGKLPTLSVPQFPDR